MEISEQVAPDPRSWLELRHTLRVINADGQNADWEGLIKLSRPQVAAKAASGGSGERATDSVAAAAVDQRQPTQDSESRIPAAPGDPGGGADTAEAEEDKARDDRET